MKFAHHRRCITPKVGVGLQGYLRKPTSRGICDDLFLQVLLLVDSRGKPLLLVQADLIGFDGPFTGELIRWAAGRYPGLDESSILFSATHTHCGPSTVPIIPSVGVPSPDYLKSLREFVKEGVDDVFGHLREGKLFAGKGALKLGVNRRRVRGGTIDPDLFVLLVRGRKDEVVLFNHACHPITMNGYNISADFPGVAQERVRASSRGIRREGIFLQGAGGDIAPPCFDKEGVFRPGGKRKAVKVGHRLYRGIEGILRKKLRTLKTRFSSKAKSVIFPFDRRYRMSDNPYARNAKLLAEWRRLRRWRQKHGRKDGVTLRWVHWDLAPECSITALGGEVVHGIGLEAKRIVGKEFSLFLGYANDIPNYVPTDEILEEGGYEVDATIFFGQPYAFRKGGCGKVMQCLEKMIRGGA